MPRATSTRCSFTLASVSCVAASGLSSGLTCGTRSYQEKTHNKLIADGSQKTWRALFQCGFSSWSRAVEVVGATSTSELTKTPQVIFHNPYLLPWLFFYLDFETARSGRNGLLEGPRMVGSRSWGVIIAGCHLTVLIISAPWNICLTLAANYSHM